MAKLGSDVSLIRGHKRRGSSYYLIDNRRYREYHISENFAQWLTGKVVDNNTRENYLKFLESHKLLDKCVAVKPKQNIGAKLLSWQIELFNPTKFLKKTEKYWSFLFTSNGAAALILFWLANIFLIRGSWSEFINYTQFYATDAQAIIIGIVITKTLHELGHAASLVKNGAKVINIGLVLIALFPLPKTQGYLLCKLSKKERLQVSLGGIYIEIWIAAISTFFWIGFDDSSLRVVAHFLAVISLGLTITLNLMPLMKFDGYQALSAFTDSPNLYENALSIFRRNCYSLFGKNIETGLISSNASERILFAYGFCIFLWKLTLPAAIASGVISLFGRPALLMAALVCYLMLIKPATIEFKKFKSAEKAPGRTMRIKTTSALALLLCLFMVAPVSHMEAYNGVIMLEQQAIIAQVDGLNTQKTKEGTVLKNKRLINIKTFQEAHERAAFLIEKSTLSKSAVERSYLMDMSENAVNKEELLLNQTKIDAPFNGFWSPSAFKSNVVQGDKLGTMYTNKGKLRVFLPFDKFKDNLYSVILNSNNGESFLINVTKTTDAVNVKLLPKWLTINQKNYTIFEANYISEQELPVTIYIKRNYSLAYEFIKRLYLRS